METCNAIEGGRRWPICRVLMSFLPTRLVMIALITVLTQVMIARSADAPPAKRVIGPVETEGRSIIRPLFFVRPIFLIGALRSPPWHPCFVTLPFTHWRPVVTPHPCWRCGSLHGLRSCFYHFSVSFLMRSSHIRNSNFETTGLPTCVQLRYSMVADMNQRLPRARWHQTHGTIVIGKEYGALMAGLGNGAALCTTCRDSAYYLMPSMHCG
jgi:hypothetical protein